MSFLKICVYFFILLQFFDDLQCKEFSGSHVLAVVYLEDSFGSSEKKTASLMPESNGTMINAYTENSYGCQNSYIFSGNRKIEINKVLSHVNCIILRFELKNKDLKCILGNFVKCCNDFSNMHF